MTSAIFVLKKVLECKERPKTQSERDGVDYTNARKKRFWNTVLASVLLRKNLWNSVPARSITKIPLSVTFPTITPDNQELAVF
jgi:hypothetical protein